MSLSTTLRLSASLALLVLSASPLLAAGPTVSVSTVVVNGGGPVCRANDTGIVSVSATVVPVFDTDTSSSSTGACSGGCNSANNFCGTGNSSVNRRQTVTTTSKTYTFKTVLGSASDNNGSSNGPAFDVSSGNFGTLPNGPEGKTTVTVTAQASELETITTTTDTNYYGGGVCTGSILATAPGTPGVSSSTKTSTSPSANTSYLVDLLAPSITPGHPGFFNNPSTISQTQSELVHMKIDNGSAETPWSATVTALGPSPANTTTLQVTDTGTFGSSPSGIVNSTNPGPFTLPTACDTPTGLYSVSATVQTQDLCGNAFDPITVTGDDFTVTPGLSLATQTGVLSQLTGGEYGIDQCFVDSIKQQARKLIVNNTPGSAHIDTIVTTAGPCQSISSIGGVSLTLALPPLAANSSGFVYDVTGNSPNAHVFIGNGSLGFDLHEGAPLVEVTDSVTQSTSPQTPNVSQTITIDLSSLDVGSGPGVIPANLTIFARAHTKFVGYAKADQPAADTPFKFSSAAGTTDVNGSPSVLSASADYYISGNPTMLMDNLTGATTPSAQKCDANGLFVPLP